MHGAKDFSSVPSFEMTNRDVRRINHYDPLIVEKNSIVYTSTLMRSTDFSPFVEKVMKE